MPDGDIQLSVTLNAEDVRNKAERLRSAVSDMFKTSAGKELDASLMKIMTQMDKLVNKSVELETQMGNLDKIHLEQIDQAMKDIEAEITKTTQMMSEMNPDFNPEGIEQAKTTIQELSSAYQRLREEREIVMTQGSGGMGFDEYDRAATKLNEVNNELTVLRARAEDAGHASDEIGDNSERSGRRASNAFKTVSKVIQTAFASAKKLASTVGGSLQNAFNRVKKSAESAFSPRNMKRGLTMLLKYGFGVRSLYFAFRKLRNAIKEGLHNLVQYESETNATNKAMTELNTSLLYLKNAWAAALAPVINYVMPILTALIDKFAQVGNAIARFVGALTGQAQVLNAVKVGAGDYAKSLNKVGGAAKKATDRLAAFDDLNVLGKDSDAGGGGADTDTPDPSEMFKYVDAASNLADMIKQAIADQDFSGLGSALGEKIRDGLNNIPWDDIKEKVGGVATYMGQFLRGLLTTDGLFESVGNAFAEGLNTISTAIGNFLKETQGIDWGGGLANLVNTFVNNTDWGAINSNIKMFVSQFTSNIISGLTKIEWTDIKGAIKGLGESLGTIISSTLGDPAFMSTIGETLGEVFNSLGELIAGILTGTSGIGGGLASMLNDALYTVDWKLVAENFGTLLSQIFKTVSDFFNQTDFDALGTAIQTFIENVDWGTVLATAIESVIASNNGLTKLLAVFSNAISDTILTMDIDELTDDFIQIIESIDINSIAEAVGALVEASLKALIATPVLIVKIGAALVGAFLTSIDTAIRDSAEEGGADMENLGDMLIVGLANGIANAFGNVVDWVADHIVAPIVDAFEELFKINSPSKVAEDWGVFIIEGLANGITAMIDSVIQIFVNLKDSLAAMWDTIKSNAEEKWNAFKSTIATKATEIKDSAIQKITDLKDALAQKWQAIKDEAWTKFTLMRVAIVDIFTQLKEAIKSPINGFLGIIESMVNKVIYGINKVIDTLNALPDIKFTNPFTGTDYALGITIPRLPEVSIPRLAQGAVIPPNKEFMAVLGDQSHGTNVEAPLDTIKQAVAEVLANNGNAEVIQLLQQLIAVVESKNLTIGDKEIGKANARYVSQQQIVRGSGW